MDSVISISSWFGGIRELSEILCPVRLPALTEEEHRHFPEQLEWSGIGRAAKELLAKDPVYGYEGVL